MTSDGPNEARQLAGDRGGDDIGRLAGPGELAQTGGKRVAARTTLNAKNLEALGLGRLAELLIKSSNGNAAAKRRLRLELARAQSPSEVAKEVRQRLSSIARSQSIVDWQGIRALADDLDTRRDAILETVAKAHPHEALDLLRRFMALAPSISARCDQQSQPSKDRGAKRILIPIENKRNFLDVSADIMAHVDPVFYGDPGRPH
jgi:hypothetical protein